MKLRRGGIVYRILVFWYRDDEYRVLRGVSLCRTFWLLFGTLILGSFVVVVGVAASPVIALAFLIDWSWKRWVQSPTYDGIAQAEIFRVASEWFHAAKSRVCPIITFEETRRTSS